MATASSALAALRARLEASGSGITIPMRFPRVAGDVAPPPLPDTPAAFAHIVFDNLGPGRGPAAFGGGAGSNLYRNEFLLQAYVFVPIDEGMGAAMDHAETVAARLRSFRDDTVSCFSAAVYPVGEGSKLAPPGLDSEVNNYVCAVAEVAGHFDQLG